MEGGCRVFEGEWDQQASYVKGVVSSFQQRPLVRLRARPELLQKIEGIGNLSSIGLAASSQGPGGMCFLGGVADGPHWRVSGRCTSQQPRSRASAAPHWDEALLVLRVHFLDREMLNIIQSVVYIQMAYRSGATCYA